VLARLADAQHGVVTRPQLEAAGLGRGAIQHRIATRRLRPLHVGVYALGHAQLRPEGRFLAAVLACGPAAALSHRSAAAHLGLREEARLTVDVTTARRSAKARPGIQLHRVRRLEREDVTQHRGVPVTTPARTVVDLAAVLGARALERTLEQAYVQRLLRTADLEDALSRARGKRIRPLATLLEQRRPTTLTRSELEERFLALSRQAGLADPEVNARVAGYTVDFLWRDRRVVVETDGWAAHRTRRAFEHDRGRDVDLHLAGFRVHRFTYDQVVRRPTETAARLVKLLATQ
jgi:very-short-patch-repair endonuclease